MDVRKLRSIIAVGEHGTFQEAANALGLTQSAVSQHVKSLEAELSVSLFDRRGKPLSLTPIGKTLLTKARYIVASMEELEKSISGNRLSGVLSLGVLRTMLSHDLIKVLAVLQRHYPDLDIQVTTENSPDLARAVETGRVDAAILSNEVELSSELTWLPYVEDPLMVIMRAGTAGNTDQDVLTNNPYIRFSRASPVCQCVDAEIRRRAIPVKIQMEIDYFSAICLLVENGLGVSVVPKAALSKSHHDTLRAIPFGVPPLTRTIGIIEKKSNPKQKIVHTLRHELWTASGALAFPSVPEG